MRHLRAAIVLLSTHSCAVVLTACGGAAQPPEDGNPERDAGPSIDAGVRPEAAAHETGPGAPGESLSRSLSFGGARRTYVLHVPAGYDARRTYPLMVSFHGRGGTGAGIEKTTGFDAVADDDGVFVAYPDSIGPQWDPPGPTGDIAFSEALVTAIEAEYPIDPTRVYVSGFSEGGGMAQALACAFTSAIAGAADVSENLSPGFAAMCTPSEPITILSFHGTADPVSPYDGGAGSIPGVGGKNTESALETAQFWARHDGCTDSPAVTHFPDRLSDGSHVTDTERTWTDCRAGTRVVFYTIQGGGHAWPGGTSTTMEVGPSSRDVDASLVIWQTLRTMRR